MVCFSGPPEENVEDGEIEEDPEEEPAAEELFPHEGGQPRSMIRSALGCLTHGLN